MRQDSRDDIERTVPACGPGRDLCDGDPAGWVRTSHVGRKRWPVGGWTVRFRAPAQGLGGGRLLPDRVRDAGASVAFDAASLAHAVNGAVVRAGRTPIRGGAVDSRRVEPGMAFFALPGERTDGHLFLTDAVARGAAALVVSRAADLPDSKEVTVVRVDNTGVALQQAASDWRNRFDPIVVGVT